MTLINDDNRVMYRDFRGKEGTLDRYALITGDMMKVFAKAINEYTIFQAAARQNSQVRDAFRQFRDDLLREYIKVFGNEDGTYSKTTYRPKLYYGISQLYQEYGYFLTFASAKKYVTDIESEEGLNHYLLDVTHEDAVNALCSMYPNLEGFFRDSSYTPRTQIATEYQTSAIVDVATLLRRWLRDFKAEDPELDNACNRLSDAIDYFNGIARRPQSAIKSKKVDKNPYPDGKSPDPYSGEEQ